MPHIPEATPITLTGLERAELEGLARSRRSEHRLRQRARIILLAADDMATRAIARTVGCTTGTASKWRVRYAERRLAGLDETGNRGSAPIDDPVWVPTVFSKNRDRLVASGTQVENAEGKAVLFTPLFQQPASLTVS